MKTFLLLLVALLVVAMPASAALRNAGAQVPATFQGHHLTPVSPHDAVRVLYAPSEADDPAYRAGIAAWLPAGSVVDYYDARNGTPDAATLASYTAVHVWTNYALSDKITFGNRLADYVDGGGRVVLGAFCTYCFGNDLEGRIMTADYNGVTSPSCSNHFAQDSWRGDDADKCDYTGVTSWSALYRDYLALQGAGIAWGHFNDGEIADAVGPNEAVHYVNGSGGSPILVDPGIEYVVANACTCGLTPPVPVINSTWTKVKSLYR